MKYEQTLVVIKSLGSLSLYFWRRTI